MSDPAERWVVNASPLIVLAKVGHLALLEDTTVEVLVPDAVVREVIAGPADDPARRAIELGWGLRIEDAPTPQAVLEWSLGQGESAVVAAALSRPGSIAVVDDAQARRCARTLNVRVMGTLGVVIRAKRLGRISSAATVLGALRSSGLYLDDTLVSAALALVDETLGS